MKLMVYDTAGKALREIDAADEVFGIEPNRSVLHQAYVAQMSNRRGGNASTRRRGEVAGSTFKTRRQKGLGRSRQGGIRASHHVGGGVAHGPQAAQLPKRPAQQMERLALRSALSSHAAGGTLIVMEGLMADDAKTKSVQSALDAIHLQRRALIVTGEHDAALQRAGSQYRGCESAPGPEPERRRHLVNAHRLVMSEEAVRRCEALWGGEN